MSVTPYQMMVNNAAAHISKQNPERPKEGDFNAFQISEVLGLVLCKAKEEIAMDIAMKVGEILKNNPKNAF